MKLNLKAAASIATLAAILAAPAALADTAEADCVLRKDGENKEGASGPCSFSQRQGYADIDLRNGATFSLSPGNEHPGDTPHDLKDLPGGQLVGGEVDDEMVRRGYRYVRDEQSGGQVWSRWHSNHGGHCVVVHMGEKRHVKSVANAAKSDCG